VGLIDYPIEKPRPPLIHIVTILIKVPSLFYFYQNFALLKLRYNVNGKYAGMSSVSIRPELKRKNGSWISMYVYVRRTRVYAVPLPATKWIFGWRFSLHICEQKLQSQAAGRFTLSSVGFKCREKRKGKEQK
jgi:hypothetical protein